MPLIAAAIIPSFILMAWFHRRDRNREPLKVLWGTAGLGVLSVIPVLIVVSTYGKLIHSIEAPWTNGIMTAFFSAAIPEEFFKFLVLVLFAARLRDFDEPMDGVVYGVAASLGFATIENILYVSQGGWVVAVLRAVTSVPAHALFGAVMGVYVGRAKFQPTRRNWYLGQALFWPILLHGLYDAPLLASRAAYARGSAEEFQAGWLLLVPAVMLASTIWVWRRVADLRAEQLQLKES